MYVYQIKCMDEDCNFAIQSSNKSYIRKVRNEHIAEIGHDVSKIRLVEKDGIKINKSYF